MQIRLVHTHYIGSRPGLTERWSQGEVREVSAEDGAYLLGTFPEWFEVAAPADVVEAAPAHPVVATVVAAPPVSRPAPSPSRGRR